MEILRSFFALLAGFATMELIIGSITVVLARRPQPWIGPPNRPAPAFIAASLGYTFVAAAAGGYVCAWTAVNRPLHTVLTLAIVVLAFGAISILQLRGTRPVRYQLALVIVSTVGVMAGGLLRLKIAGLL